MRLFTAFLPGLGVALALLLFAYALGLIRFGGPEQVATGGPDREVERIVSRGNEQLEAELSRAELKIRILTEDLEKAEQAAAAATARATPPKTDEDSPPEDLVIPENVLAAGKVVGASEAALKAAYRLEMSVRNRTSAPGALDEFIAQGADGFKALVALMRSGLRATWQKDWLKKTYQPGLEQVLIDFAEDPEQEGNAGIALSCLSIADTQRVRDYLVEKVQKDPSPGTVYQAAEALGALKEPRGAAAIGMVFAQPDWGGVRGSILYHLGQMGGTDARRILIEYLHRDKADKLGAAINALNAIDKDVAKREATRILNRQGAEFLHFMDRSALKKIAEQE